MGAGVVEAAGIEVELGAKVAVLPKSEVVVGCNVEVACNSGPWTPPAKAVWVAMVLKMDSSGSSVSRTTGTVDAERVQADNSIAQIAKIRMRRNWCIEINSEHPFEATARY